MGLKSVNFQYSSRNIYINQIHFLMKQHITRISPQSDSSSHFYTSQKEGTIRELLKIFTNLIKSYINRKYIFQGSLTKKLVQERSYEKSLSRNSVSVLLGVLEISDWRQQQLYLCTHSKNFQYNIIFNFQAQDKMCKRNFVAVSMAKRKYKILADDISKVHTMVRRKLPPLPSFQSTTDCQISAQQAQTIAYS